MPIVAGTVILANGAKSGQPLICLSAPDMDGYVRFAPLVPADARGDAAGMMLESSDFSAGSATGWVRLDRVGWQYIDAPNAVGVLKPAALGRLHRALCTQEARNYAAVVMTPQAFVPGRTPVPPAGKVIGARELELLVESSLDGWLTAGRFNVAFERKLGTYLGRKHVRTTNSGSSANLLAMTAAFQPR
jgi:CDP-6-deoxy-D-xylo-4-hexulose-3-dehydrase